MLLGYGWDGCHVTYDDDGFRGREYKRGCFLIQMEEQFAY